MLNAVHADVLLFPIAEVAAHLQASTLAIPLHGNLASFYKIQEYWNELC